MLLPHELDILIEVRSIDIDMRVMISPNPDNPNEVNYAYTCGTNPLSRGTICIYNL